MDGSQRTKDIKKNILGSAGLKVINIIVSLSIIPLSMDYVGKEQFGLWLTVSTIILWFAYFDLGFVHGFRNRFAEARAQGNDILARQYVSTTYAVISIIFVSICLILLLANKFIDWCSLLNEQQLDNAELQQLFDVIIIFFCGSFIFNAVTTLLTADQRPALGELIRSLGQIGALITIILLNIIWKNGSIVDLAFAFAGVPCIITLISNIIVFSTKRYRHLSPRLRDVKFSLTGKIIGLGVKFFLIMVSMVLIFQFVSVVLKREMNGEAVTQYNIAFKYFHIINMAALIIINPFWSAFTDAWTKGDRGWMTRALQRLEKMYLYLIPGALLMLAVSGIFYHFWIGDRTEMPFMLSVMMMCFVMAQTLGGMYMNLINGIGKVQLQTIIYTISAVFAYPLLVFTCRSFGVAGVLLLPTAVYLLQALTGRIQLAKLIHGSATGIWNK